MSFGQWKTGRVAVAAGLLVAASLASQPARAQADAAKDFPNRPIHVVVGFAAGGGNDLFARVAGQKLSEILKQPVVIDNKPGAGARVAAEIVAKANPDGYTMMVAPSGSMVMAQAIYSKMNYDPQRDFTPVTEIAHYSLVLVVSGKSPYKTIPDLVAYAKANPAKANYASTSPTFQIATELFKLRTGMPAEMVAYKSSGEMVMAVISGESLFTFTDMPPVSGHLDTGDVRVLAVTGPKHLEELPKVPTLEEAGIKDATIEIWSGLFVPKATPPAIVAKLEAASMEAVKSPDVQEKLRNLGVEPSGMTGAEFAQVIDRDLRQAVAVARAANVKIDE
jgi:tripartite-type tricarboxylate transporter receptor subunit TctC